MRTFDKSLAVARSLKGLGVVLVVSVAVLGPVCVASASAASLGVTPVGSFGGFTQPQSVAVDQGTGDVYVLDVGTQTLSRFDGEGNPAPFAAAESYVAGDELTGTPGAPGETVPFGFVSGEAQVAVDDSSGPAEGEIYVTDATSEKVDVFAADGTFLGEINPALAVPTTGGTPCGVAVDPDGEVWVAHLSGHADEYAPHDAGPADDTFTRQFGTIIGTCSVAADATGGLYGMAESLLVEYPRESFPVGFATVSSAAFDSATNDVFIDELTHVVQVDASGAKTGFEFGDLTESLGVAYDATTSKVYLSDQGTGTVDIYQLPFPATPLLEGGEEAANVASSSAELKALVNPHLASTHYYFQYGTNTTYTAGSTPNTAGIPVGESGEGQQAHVAISGLQPNTLYHFRIVAFNQVKGKTETATGPDHTFTTSQTPPAPTPVAIQNPPAESSSAGTAPQPPDVYPNLTALKPIPGPNETAGKHKATTKAKPCKKNQVRRHGKCVKRPKTKRANHDKGSK